MSHQCGIVALVSQISFRSETSGGVTKCWLPCSKHSDSGERCKVKKAMKSKEVTHLSPSLVFTFSHSFLLRTAPQYLNPWNRLNVGCFLRLVREIKHRISTQLQHTLQQLITKDSPTYVFPNFYQRQQD